MKNFSLLILTLLCVTSLFGAGPKLTMAEKQAIAEEGIALRREATYLTDDRCVVVDTLKMEASIEKIRVFTDHNRKAPNRYFIYLAENYFNLNHWEKAQPLYKSHLSDGLAQLRLGLYLTREGATKEELSRAINYITNGLSMQSGDTIDYPIVQAKAQELLPLCYHRVGDDDNARRYHRAYTNATEGESYDWLYRIYWEAGDSAKALELAILATRIEPNNPNTNETLAGHYFNLQQYDLAFPYWEKAARLGNALSQVRVAQAYYYEMGCEKNDSLATYFFEQGLKTIPWVWAQRLLAKLYLSKGAQSSKADVDKAIYWLNQASDRDDWIAKSMLAENLSYWARQPLYKAKRLAMLNQANQLALELMVRDQKDSVAWQVLGGFLGDSLLSLPKVNSKDLRSKRPYLAINPKRDLEICERLAKDGDIQATIQLGKAYSSGKHTYTDFFGTHTVKVDTIPNRSFFYWQKGLALDPGNAECIKGITNAYTYGIGTEKDILRAKKFWESNGMPNYAGTFFYPWRTYKIQHGDYDEIIYQFTYYDVTKLLMPVSESIGWLKMAATKGSKEQRNLALYLLATMYEQGKYVQQDYSLAVEYYKQSAALDNANANHRLGEVYKYGELNTNRNFSTAAKFYRRSYQLTNNQDDYWEYMDCTQQ